MFPNYSIFGKPAILQRWRSCINLASSAPLLVMLLFLVPEMISANKELQCPNLNASNTDRSPRQMNPLNITVSFFTSLSKKGLGKRIAGAYFLAITKLNQEASITRTPVSFNPKLYETDQDEMVVIKNMVDVYGLKENTSFVGTESYCQIAARIATALGIPLLAYNCEDVHNRTGPYLMVNTDPSIAHASIYIVSILEHFKWKSFWLIHGSIMNWRYAAKTLQKDAAEKNISLNGITEKDSNNHFSKFYGTHAYKDTVTESKDKTRVYVYMGAHESLIIFLRELYEQGVTKEGKHVVLAVLDETEVNENYHLLTFEKSNDTFKRSNHDSLLAAFRNTLLIHALVNYTVLENFDRQVNERNYKPPINLPTLNPGTLPGGLNITGIQYNPKVNRLAYHLYDATMIYGRTVMALMAKPEADPTNATQVICHIRKSMTYTSIVGHSIEFLSNGESRSTYVVQAPAYKEGRIQKNLQTIGTFKNHKFQLLSDIDWVSGKPESEPDCGFQGELCPTKEEHREIYIIVGVCLPMVIVFFSVISFLWYKRHKYEKKLEQLAWKINNDDIERTDDTLFKTQQSSSKSKKKLSVQGNNQLKELLSSTDDLSDPQSEEDSIDKGMYKGSKIVIKTLAPKQWTITRPLKKQLQVRKEMSHENINRFIGACIDSPQVLLVSLYCSRNSLKDIMEDSNIKHLDDTFITSFVQDIIKGMTFIHESTINWHGNLKSSNCLVDSRWTVQISDFGFSTIGPPPRAASNDEKLFQKLLWTAPELLTSRLNRSISSNSNTLHSQGSNHNHSNRISNGGLSSGQVMAHHDGTQKGDVYSFAIILYELYGKKGPWGPTELKAKDIIEKLSMAPSGQFRPDTSILMTSGHGQTVKSLIESCWAVDLSARYDFKHICDKYKPVVQKYLGDSTIIDNMVNRLEKHNNALESDVAERTKELRIEQKKTENLLLRMLPRSVAEMLIKGQTVTSEQFECVTIYFSDIVGFTEFSAKCAPIEVVNFLNELYTRFDNIIGMFDVYKVETIGDAYMVVSGLPKLNGDKHAGEIASMSLMIQSDVQKQKFSMQKTNGGVVKIRIGIHSGPCCAGVVGLKMPRYCLFGDTVNTANRMESTGEAFKIHCSSTCKQILDKLGGYHLEERGYTDIKGKGKLLTYFLLGEIKEQRQRRLSEDNNGNRCVSSSNLDYKRSLNLHCRGIPGHNLGHAGSVTSSTVSLPQQSTQPSVQLRNNYAERSMEMPYLQTCSLNASMDCSWSETQEDPTPLNNSDSQSNNGNMLHRSSSTKQTGALNMSPIAEHPCGASSDSHEWNQILSRNSQPIPERDSLTSCHALTSSGKYPARRKSDNNFVSFSNGSSEERKSLMTPETIL